ncbi:MAG: NUDIX domain-containing protein [candidate division FCPU426 bacterium]
MEASGEWFEVVDAEGRVLKLARREECHADPSLMHRVAHVLVFDPEGRLYLQLRSRTKDIQPGKWDTSVGGHLQPGETELAGAQRELQEELGVQGAALELLYHYIMRSPVETELVATFKTVWQGEIRPDPLEIEDGRFWEPAEIQANLGRGIFTPNFEDEYSRWQKVAPPA